MHGRSKNHRSGTRVERMAARCVRCAGDMTRSNRRSMDCCRVRGHRCGRRRAMSAADTTATALCTCQRWKTRNYKERKKKAAHGQPPKFPGPPGRTLLRMHSASFRFQSRRGASSYKPHARSRVCHCALRAPFTAAICCRAFVTNPTNLRANSCIRSSCRSRIASSGTNSPPTPIAEAPARI